MSWRLQPRLRRIRLVLPELAGIGATPALDPADLVQPGEQRAKAGWIVAKRRLAERNPDVIDGARRQRGLVGVNADHAHRQTPFLAGYDGRGPGAANVR